ncbi:hypothetical protein QUW14_04220 [Bacteroides gallinaceum]|uniref:hypothetical protein n=1 Tax=Bacteroides gallinaceum TaxID=1462571 RepID=UPI0025A48456|nr:hypothetical protein [Bacteroides gallinaceum]MDM8153528.1 hypothetical protein [Bacteroides gallinaceum]
MIWDEFLRHFRFCDEEDSGLSDEEQERKGPKNRPKHTRKRIDQAKKNFLEKFKTASKRQAFSVSLSRKHESTSAVMIYISDFTGNG